MSFRVSTQISGRGECERSQLKVDDPTEWNRTVQKRKLNGLWINWTVQKDKNGRFPKVYCPEATLGTFPTFHRPLFPLLV